MKRQTVGGELSADRKAAWAAWAGDWRRQLQAEGRQDDERQAAQNAVNPAYIPRNHIMQTAIAAAEKGNSSEVLPFSMLTLHTLRTDKHRATSYADVKTSPLTLHSLQQCLPRVTHCGRSTAVSSCLWRQTELYQVALQCFGCMRSEPRCRSQVNKLMAVLKRPFEEQPGAAAYTVPAPKQTRVGVELLSCSS